MVTSDVHIDLLAAKVKQKLKSITARLELSGLNLIKIKIVKIQRVYVDIFFFLETGENQVFNVASEAVDYDSGSSGWKLSSPRFSRHFSQ